MTQEGRVLAGCVAGMRDPKMRAHLVNCLLRTAMGDAWPYDQSPPGGVDPRTTAQRDGRQVLALFDAQNASKVEGVS
ncbi:MAG: hypothetical protein CFE45_28780 [Burkholderiales bacterium PBB5]|nr:MAG: hypothetical protein CFE45_28780 [Burkholderiales bacterium PBB5]